MTEQRYPMASGKKTLVATHNENASAIIVKYDPAGSVLPKALSGEFTTFEKAGQAIKIYLSQFTKSK